MRHTAKTVSPIVIAVALVSVACSDDSTPASSQITCSTGTKIDLNAVAHCKSIYDQITACCTDKTIGQQKATEIVCGMAGSDIACQAGGSSVVVPTCAALGVRPECKGGSADRGSADRGSTDGGSKDMTRGDHSKASCTDVCTGLVGWWSFEESLASKGAVVHDGSGLGNDGVLGAGANASTAGKVGQGFVLDSTSVIDVPNASSLNPTSLTVMYWVKLSQLPTGQAGVVKRTGDNSDATFQAVINSGSSVGSGGVAGKPDFSYYNTHWHDRTADAAITANAWHHLAYTFDGTSTTGALFVDGAPASSQAYSGSSKVSKEDEALKTTFTSGVHFNGGYAGGKLQGVMDEVRIYNRALSPTEVQTVYNASK